MAIAEHRYREASEDFARAVRYSGGAPYSVGLRALALGFAGERGRAQHELDALSEAANERHVPAIGIALAHVGLNQRDRAFEWLDRSFEERDIVLLLEVLYFRQLDGLLDDPRMIDLRRRIAQCGVRVEVE